MTRVTTRLASLAWQCFAAPVPASSSDGPGLLQALSAWVRAEAAAVRAKGTGGPTAAAYAAALHRWADAVGGKTPIPRLTAALRKAACAVDALSDERLALAVALYRRDYREVTMGVPEFTGLSPAERPANRKRKRTPAEEAAQLAAKQEIKKRKAVERAWAVRVRVGVSPHALGETYVRSCLRWQAAGLPRLATHEAQVGVMLTAITEGLREATAGTNGRVESGLAVALVAYEKAWVLHRDDRTKPPPGVFQECSENANRKPAGTVKALHTVHARLDRLVAAKKELDRFCSLTPAEKVEEIVQKQARTTRKDVERACAVRVPWLSPAHPHLTFTLRRASAAAAALATTFYSRPTARKKACATSMVS